MVNLDDATVTGSNSGDYVTNAQLGALPLKAAKMHDYFTSALPSPQKGPDVAIPLDLEGPAWVTTKPATEAPKTGNYPLMWVISCFRLLKESPGYGLDHPSSVP